MKPPVTTLASTVTAHAKDSLGMRLRKVGVGLLLLVTFSAAAQAQSASDFVTKTINNQITITGYIGSAQVVVIPSTLKGLPVTTLGDYSFGSNVTSVTIPNSVASIGEYAFDHDKSLTTFSVSAQSVYYSSLDGVLFNQSKSKLVRYPAGSLRSSYTMPVGVHLGNNAFSECTHLTSVTLPTSLISIGSEAFYGCTSLTTVIIPSTVTSIGSEAFAGCTSLNSVTIPSSVTTITDYTFGGCTSLASVIIPSSVTTIRSYAFVSCSSLIGMTIPNSVVTIGSGAFADCSSLISLTIPNRVTTITDYTFYGCSSLASVTIPSSVTGIGDYAFTNCTNLTTATIPSNVTNIGKSAFDGCASLKRAFFMGNAPVTGAHVFLNTANTFTVNYYNGASGFLSPIWTDSVGDQYPAVNVGIKPRAPAQTIIFPAIGNQVYGAIFDAGGVASSGLPVTYSWAGPAKVYGNIVVATGLGTVSIRAHQNGDADYSAAPTVLQQFTVSSAPQTITFPAVAAGKVGQTITLKATASSDLPITYSVVPTTGYTGRATISGSSLTFTAAGNLKLAANQAGNADYTAAPRVIVTVNVAP